MKNQINIILQPKGGVGKSTFAQQILAPFYYDKFNKKIKLIEIDDENKDSLTFYGTQIMDTKMLKTQDIKNIDEIFFSDENYIVDIGGNKTATIFLNELKKVNEFEKIMFWIPLGIGEQDNLNALETYNKIKEMNANANIAFVLSRANATDLEWEFVNFFGHEFLPIEFAINQQIKNAEFVVVKSSPIVNNARYFGRTVYDLTLSSTDYREKAKKEEDSTEKRRYIFLNRSKNEAIEYANDMRANIFPKIAQILEKI